MIPLEDFKKAYDLLHNIGLDVYINSSNLLGLMLTGELFENDYEIDFNTFEASNESIIQLCNNLSFKYQSGSVTNTGICYFQFPTQLGLSQVKLMDNFAYDNVGTNYFHIWPKEWLLPHGIFKWKGFELYVPNRPDKVLESLYGKDWSIRKLNWAWMDCPTLIKANHVSEAIEVYKNKNV